LLIYIVSLSRFNCQEENKIMLEINGNDEPISSPKIVGGIDAGVGEYPAQISIQTRTGSHFCGGTLIDHNHVLTAAHCVTSSTGAVHSPSVYNVMGNSLTVSPLYNSNNQSRDATHVFVHPQYNLNSLINDIAIIRVSPSFTSTNSFYPTIRINETPVTNYNCSVAGWGTLSYNGVPSSTLQRVDVLIISTAQCNSTYGGLIGPTMICAGHLEGGKDSCQGDSGGGLYCGNLLTGVVSFGYECALPGIPGVYTNVASYDNFINQAVVYTGTHSSVPTPTTRRPSNASPMLLSISIFTVMTSVSFVLLLR